MSMIFATSYWNAQSYTAMNVGELSSKTSSLNVLTGMFL